MSTFNVVAPPVTLLYLWHRVDQKSFKYGILLSNIGNGCVRCTTTRMSNMFSLSKAVGQLTGTYNLSMSLPSGTASMQEKLILVRGALYCSTQKTNGGWDWLWAHVWKTAGEY